MEENKLSFVDRIRENRLGCTGYGFKKVYYGDVTVKNYKADKYGVRCGLILRNSALLQKFKYVAISLLDENLYLEFSNRKNIGFYCVKYYEKNSIGIISIRKADIVKVFAKYSGNYETKVIFETSENSIVKLIPYNNKGK